MSSNIIESIPILVTLAFALQISLVDIRELRIPNRILLPGMLIATLSVIFTGLLINQFSRALLALAGSLLSLALFFCIHLLRPKGLGMGDVKFAALIGLALSWISFPAGLIGLGLSFVASSLFSLLVYMVKRSSFNRVVPFAPFMLIGLLFVQFGALF